MHKQTHIPYCLPACLTVHLSVFLPAYLPDYLPACLLTYSMHATCGVRGLHRVPLYNVFFSKILVHETLTPLRSDYCLFRKNAIVDLTSYAYPTAAPVILALSGGGRNGSMPLPICHPSPLPAPSLLSLKAYLHCTLKQVSPMFGIRSTRHLYTGFYPNQLGIKLPQK